MRRLTVLALTALALTACGESTDADGLTAADRQYCSNVYNTSHNIGTGRVPSCKDTVRLSKQWCDNLDQGYDRARVNQTLAAGLQDKGWDRQAAYVIAAGAQTYYCTQHWS